MKILVLRENLNELNESNMITFNGETKPEFGWAIIMAGGSGSGKGYVIKNHLGLPYKIIDVDKYKKDYIKLKATHSTKYEDDGIKFWINNETLDKLLTKKEFQEHLGDFFQRKRYNR